MRICVHEKVYFHLIRYIAQFSEHSTNIKWLYTFSDDLNRDPRNAGLTGVSISEALRKLLAIFEQNVMELQTMHRNEGLEILQLADRMQPLFKTVRFLKTQFQSYRMDFESLQVPYSRQGMFYLASMYQELLKETSNTNTKAMLSFIVYYACRPLFEFVAAWLQIPIGRKISQDLWMYDPYSEFFIQETHQGYQVSESKLDQGIFSFPSRFHFSGTDE